MPMFSDDFRGQVTAQDWYTVQGRSEVGPDGMGKKYNYAISLSTGMRE